MIAGPLVLLAACGGKPKVEPETKPVAEAATDFSKPMYARGSDPNWGLTIRGTDLTFSRIGQPDLMVKPPGAVILAGQASWTATLPDGRILTAKLFASDCLDPVSETTYPFAAEVDLTGDEPFTGCGYRIK